MVDGVNGDSGETAHELVVEVFSRRLGSAIVLGNALSLV